MIAVMQFRNMAGAFRGLKVSGRLWEEDAASDGALDRTCEDPGAEDLRVVKA